MDKSRIDFELYMMHVRGASKEMMSIDKLSGMYKYAQVEWSIWQASRGVYVDGIPDESFYGYSDDVYQAMKLTGYKFKE